MATKRRRSTVKKVTHRRRRSAVSGVHHNRPRRRRISGTGGAKHDITDIALMVGGAVIARIAAVKLKDKLNPKMLAGGQIVAGFFVPHFIKNKMVTAISRGILVNGALSMLNQMGVIGAIGEMVGADDGSMQLEYLSGTDQLNSLAGDDDEFGALEDKGTMSGGTDRLSILAGEGSDWETQMGRVIGDEDDY